MKPCERCGSCRMQTISPRTRRAVMGLWKRTPRGLPDYALARALADINARYGQYDNEKVTT